MTKKKCIVKGKTKIPSFEELLELEDVHDVFEDRFNDLMRYSVAGVKDENIRRVHDDVEKIVLEEFRDYYDETVNALYAYGGAGGEVYRAIVVENIDKFIDDVKKYKKSMVEGDLTGIGIYWAFDENSAVPYWRERCDESKEIVLEATVCLDDIDIVETVKTALLYEGEREIRLIEGREVLLERINLPDAKWVVMNVPVII
jgi:hypothetical protein